MRRAKVRFCSLITAFTLLASIVGGAAAQQKEQPLKLRTELLQFDVVVTNKHGDPVTNLKKDDFELLDDGKPEEISFFSLEGPEAVKAGVAAPEPASNSHPGVEAPPTSGRYIFLIFDPFFIQKENLPRLEQSLGRFIDHDLLPEDQVAVITTTGSLAGFQCVTRNRGALMLAIEALLGGHTDYASLAAVDSSLTDISGDTRFSSALPSMYKEYQLRATLSTLVNIAKATADIPGRKIAIFVTENLPTVIENGSDQFENLFSELQDLISASRVGGLTFYTLDPRGLVTTIPGGSASEVVGKSAMSSPTPIEDPGAIADRLLNSREGLRELAAATGGFAILNHNDLEVGLKQVIRQNDAYYVLAFYPEDSGKPNKFHKVKIRVKGHPELVVSTRKGYTPEKLQKPASRHEDKQERVKEALGSLIPLQDIKVAILEPQAVRDKEGDLVARMIIQIDAKTWPFREHGKDHQASFEVAGFAYDVHNKLVDGYSKEYNLKLQPEVYEKVLQVGMNLHGEIKLKKKGLYNIRLLVTDKETGRMGTANDWVIAQ